MAGIRVRTLRRASPTSPPPCAAGLAGIFVGGIVVSPGVNPGAAYLLGPVAAVVLGGAALSGGLASPTSTWVAAFFVTILNQMLQGARSVERRRSTSSSGWRSSLGMVISGDRIADVVGRLLLRPRASATSSTEEQPISCRRTRTASATNPKGEYHVDTSTTNRRRRGTMANWSPYCGRHRRGLGADGTHTAPRHGTERRRIGHGPRRTGDSRHRTARRAGRRRTSTEATLDRRRVRRELHPRPGRSSPQGLGGAGSLPEEERARNIALATIARASIPVDEDLALQCWEDNGCDTGTGGELKVGLADGFGGNIARQIFKMEFILQALTYPEVGEIGYTDANLDTQKAISDVRSFAAQGYDVILSFPDAGEAMVPAYRAATEQGAQVVTWSSRQGRRARHRLPHLQRQRHLRPRPRLG